MSNRSSLMMIIMVMRMVGMMKILGIMRTMMMMMTMMMIVHDIPRNSLRAGTVWVNCYDVLEAQVIRMMNMTKTIFIIMTMMMTF